MTGHRTQATIFDLWKVPPPSSKCGKRPSPPNKALSAKKRKKEPLPTEYTRIPDIRPTLQRKEKALKELWKDCVTSEKLKLIRPKMWWDAKRYCDGAQSYYEWRHLKPHIEAIVCDLCENGNPSVPYTAYDDDTNFVKQDWRYICEYCLMN